MAQRRLDIVKVAAGQNWFTARQIVGTIQQFGFDSGKVDAAAAMWSHMVDPENGFTVFDAFSFDSSKQQLKRKIGQ